MMPGNTSSPTLAAAATEAALWRHFWAHLWVGMGIWLVAGSLFTLFEFVSAARMYKGGYLPAGTAIDVAAFCLLELVVLAGFSLLAALGGLLRLPALGWLSRRARSRAAFLAGSLLLFEATVGIAALAGWVITGVTPASQLSTCLLACFLISLPWLVATLWASWRLAARLPLP